MSSPDILGPNARLMTETESIMTGKAPSFDMTTPFLLRGVVGRSNDLPVRSEAIAARRGSADAIELPPLQAIHCGPAGAVFGADPAFPAHCVDRVEDHGIIQFAPVRRQPRRRACELHVPDQRQVLFHALDHVTLHDL